MRRFGLAILVMALSCAPDRPSLVGDLADAAATAGADVRLSADTGGDLPPVADVHDAPGGQPDVGADVQSEVAPDSFTMTCGDGVCNGEESAPSCPEDCAFLASRYAGLCAQPGSWSTCPVGYVCIAKSSAAGDNVCVADFETWPTLPAVHPASDFAEFADYVLDKKTGLSWAKPYLAVDSTTDLAVCATRTYGNFVDWRLPTEAELLSLVDYAAYAPASSAPNLSWPPWPDPAFYQGHFLSGTPALKSGSGYGWGVDLQYDGAASGNDGPLGWGYVRCVRADGPSAAGVGSRFAVGADGATFLDRLSGLHWQRQAGTTSPWSEAKSACDQNTAGLPGTGWRLPTATELRNLADRQSTASYGPVLGLSAAVPNWGGWTSTPAWVESFKSNGQCCDWSNSATVWNFDCAPDGQNFSENVANWNWRRCVR